MLLLVGLCIQTLAVVEQVFMATSSVMHSLHRGGRKNP